MEAGAVTCVALSRAAHADRCFVVHQRPTAVFRRLRVAAWGIPAGTAAAAAPTRPGPLRDVRLAATTAAARGSRKGQQLPEPAAHQQTLRRSFTVGGVGLHAGEYAIVRVRPALAGEGRYFVVVPPGTNESHWQVEQPVARQLEELEPNAAGMADDSSAVTNAKLFFDFVKSQESGAFSGTFADFFQQRTQPELMLIEAEAELHPDEEPTVGQPGEVRLPANASSLRKQGPRWCSVLEQGGAEIWGAEHLLATLECCGVDNARIEVEGGREIPIVDGSALGWAAEVQRTGLRAAPATAAADGHAPRGVHALQEEVTVRDGEAFIAFHPGPYARVTVGLDCMAEAPVIGRQWFSWSPEDPAYHVGEHFKSALAPARTVFASDKVVQAVSDEGMLQGGSEYVSLIGEGDDWEDPTMVRFSADEAARHAVVDLLGDLSLLAQPGGRGLPRGHIVAYQPTHTLHAAFVQQMERVLAAGGAEA